MTNPAMQDQDISKTISPMDVLGNALHEDMVAVNKVILDRMQSDVPMIPELAGYLIAAGGKRIRPLLTLACSYVLGDNGDKAKKMAAAVEFIHTATLLHDDVVDGSDQRRGKPSANEVFGNQSSVLVGDFLFARAFELMVETGHMQALESLSRASRIITEGEVLQMSLIGETSITKDQYFKVIEAKTAALFAAATEVSPLLINKAPESFTKYGYALGMAFQIIDDVMDYTSPKMGKDKGDDFMEGKLTLPVIIALESANDADKDLIQQSITSPSMDQFDRFVDCLNTYNAFEKSIAMAQDFADKASDALADCDDLVSGDVFDALVQLPQSILSRVI